MKIPFTREEVFPNNYNMMKYRKASSSKYGNDKWVEHNKKEFGVQIIALKKIIEEQVRAGTQSDGFTSDMLVAMQSGRKITPKMENAINNIIKRNAPEELYKRDEWVARVVPKVIMVRNMIDETTWTTGYKDETVRFLDSVIKQAKSRKSLSKKQMEAVSKLYIRVKKNIEKNENKS
jgi:hypothetical protein